MLDIADPQLPDAQPLGFLPNPVAQPFRDDPVEVFRSFLSNSWLFDREFCKVYMGRSPIPSLVRYAHMRVTMPAVFQRELTNSRLELPRNLSWAGLFHRFANLDMF